MDNLSQSKSSIASSAGKFVKMSQSTKLGVATLTFKTLPLHEIIVKTQNQSLKISKTEHGQFKRWSFEISQNQKLTILKV